MQDESKCFIQEQEQEISLLLLPFLLFTRDKPHTFYGATGQRNFLNEGHNPNDVTWLPSTKPSGCNCHTKF